MKRNYKKLLTESLNEAAEIRLGAKATRETMLENAVPDLTEAEKLEIDRRITAYDANPSSGRSWAEARERLQQS